MKWYFIPLFLSLSVLGFAAEPIKVSSEMKQVTVYLHGAVIKSKASVAVPAGKSTLLFTGLSHAILRESIRLKPESCQILSLTLKKNYLNMELRDEKIKKLKEEYDALSKKKTELADELAIFAREKEMILANKTISGEKNGLEPDKLRSTADFYRSRLMDILEKENAIQANIKKSTKRMQELAAQINESASKNMYPSGEVEVLINAPKAATAQFELEYFITEAGWFPVYDFRVNDLATPMEIDYVAQVYQNSGLDWQQVEVTLSSADPSNNGTLPQLKTWYISQYNSRLNYDIQKPISEQGKIYGKVMDQSGNPIPFAAISVENSSVGTVSDMEGNYSLQLPPGTRQVKVNAIGYLSQNQAVTGEHILIILQENVRSLETVVVTSNRYSKNVDELSLDRKENSSAWEKSDFKKAESGKIIESNVNTTNATVSVEYTLKEKMSIPSDGRPYTAQIMKREILAQYKHIASPKLSKEAYLNVFVPDWEKLNLLEGEVNLYFANSFTGKSVISLRELKDSLAFSLGKDPNIKIQRTLTYQKTTGGGILPNKNSEYKWATEIRNTGAMTVKLSLSEPFPISTDKEIKVSLDRELSNAQVDTEKGLLNWEIELKPGEQKRIEFGFGVLYPKNLTMRFE